MGGEGGGERNTCNVAASDALRLARAPVAPVEVGLGEKKLARAVLAPRPMTKTRIVILGSGMAALSAAMRLTRAAADRERFAITIYTPGWLVGGKGASVRNRQLGDRIEEHGLHILLGFYENAFRVIREAYAELDRKGGVPLARFEDAFKPLNEVALMEYGADGQAQPWVFRPRANPLVPGDGADLPTPREMLLLGIEQATYLLGSWAERQADGAARTRAGVAVRALGLVVRGAAATGAIAAVQVERLSRSIGRARALLERLLTKDVELRRLWVVIEFGLINLLGMLREGLLADDADFGALDDEDYRAWLRRHGASETTLRSSLLVGLYNLAFSNPDGAGAGVGLVGTMRFLLAYRGGLFWLMQAGMGETVFAPLYQVLVRRGVRFRFFHEAHQLSLHPRRDRVERIILRESAEIVGGGDYQPLIDVAGLPCFPEAPLSEQIRPADRTLTLERGRDFDSLVIGASVAALPSFCGELMVRSRRFGAMVEGLRTIRTLSLQVWSESEPHALGWRGPKVVGTCRLPYETWADLSHLTARESWSARTQLYGCGVIGDGETPLDAPVGHEAIADEARRALAIEWSTLFPAAGQGDGASSPGDVRSDGFHARVNTAPSDRYVLSVPGTTRLRLRPDESGFENVVLAGDWTRTGLDAGCIEAATMSGLMAARHLLGTSERVAGEERSARALAEARARRGQLESPRYVERPDELSMRPPFTARGVELVACLLRAPQGRLQRLVDRDLNGPLRGAARYRALPFVSFVAADMGKVASNEAEHGRRGFMREIDVGLWVPLWKTEPGRPGGRPLWYLPYVFVDNAAAMVAGRESFGFFKALARIERTGSALRPERLVVQGLALERFDPDCEAREVPLLAIVRAGDAAPSLARTVPLARWLAPQVRFAFLRQFREASQPERAVYQRVIEAEARVDSTLSLALSPHRYRVELAELASHPIASDLGLPQRSEALASFEARFDFTLAPGSEVSSDARPAFVEPRVAQPRP